MTTNQTISHGAPRWFDTNAANIPQKTTIAASLSLGIFLIALESDRIPAVATVKDVDPFPFISTLIVFLFLGACVALLFLHPAHRPASLVFPALAAFACSLGLMGKYFLAGDSAPYALQGLWRMLYSVSTPLLVYFWAQRAMPLGRPFVTKSFGIGAIILGCFMMLLIAFKKEVALGIVAALPFVGVALLPLISQDSALSVSETEKEDATESTKADEHPNKRWNPFRVISADQRSSTSTDPSGNPSVSSMIVRSFIKLVPFFCYAVIFGNVHFSWLSLQDGGNVNVLVQLGASTGSIICGIFALALTRIHWGHALETIMNLLLIVFALVALWLSSFLSSDYVFVYLVLLNIAQKLTFFLMLLFGFSFADNKNQCVSLWALSYYSFFSGTCISYLVGVNMPGALNSLAEITLAFVVAADIADIVLLYGNDSQYSAESKGVSDIPSVPDVRREKRFASGVTASPDAEHAEHTFETPSQETRHSRDRLQSNDLFSSAGIDATSYTCHLIACQYDLTRREEEILQLLVQGQSAARISEELCISVATARTHLRNIYAKLDVHNQQDIVDLYNSFSKEENGD